MSVSIKSPRQIENMREAGRLLAIVHKELHKALKPGMSTWDIDRLGETIIRDFGCIPNFKIITDTLHQSVFPSMMKLFTGFPLRSILFRRGILSVWMGA